MSWLNNSRLRQHLQAQGDVLLPARVRQFSQAALAQMLEISPSYLNQIEHDVRPLTVPVLPAIPVPQAARERAHAVVRW